MEHLAIPLSNDPSLNDNIEKSQLQRSISVRRILTHSGRRLSGLDVLQTFFYLISISAT